jgi:hypothetical protein
LSVQRFSWFIAYFPVLSWNKGIFPAITGETQRADSKADIKQVISIFLKELREIQISLKLLSGSV